MGFFRVERGTITIDDGEQAVSFLVADAEKAVPWIRDIPARTIYDQADGRPQPKLDAAIQSIEKIREILSDNYHGMTIEAARSRKKKELVASVVDVMMSPDRLFGVVFPAICGNETARGQLLTALSAAKEAQLAAEARIEAATSIDEIKEIRMVDK